MRSRAGVPDSEAAMSRQQEALVAQGVRAMLATVLSDIQVPHPPDQITPLRLLLSCY